MKTELKYIGLSIALMDPALFLISQRSGTNLHGRTVIAGIFTIAIGWLSMPLLVQGHLTRHALTLLTAEGEIAFKKMRRQRSHLM